MPVPARTAGQRKKRAPARPAWPDRFLTALRAKGTITAAALEAGVGRQTVYDEFARNPDLRAEADRIRKVECVERVEATLFQRALLGENPAFTFGYLKAHKPEMYADRLNPLQLAQIKAAALAEVQAQLEADIAELPAKAREIVMAAMRRRKELAG